MFIPKQNTTCQLSSTRRRILLQQMSPLFLLFSSSIWSVLCVSRSSRRLKQVACFPCGHSFHVKCIDMRFHFHSSCPLCRTSAQPDGPTVSTKIISHVFWRKIPLKKNHGMWRDNCCQDPKPPYFFFLWVVIYLMETRDWVVIKKITTVKEENQNERGKKEERKKGKDLVEDPYNKQTNIWKCSL
jgi:hypothetical protein